LVRTDRYIAARESLRSDGRVALWLVEDAIAADPDHTVRRRIRNDGAVIDWSAEGLLVAFRRLGPNRVELLDVVDLKDAPGWP
jgi:hypothetical protein